MRRLALLSSLGLLALAGCGTDVTGLGGDTCSTSPAELANGGVATSCTLKPGATVTLEVQPDCQRCGQSNPICNSELVGNTIELNPIYRVCQGDSTCPTTQCGARFTCTVDTPPASGTYQVKYPTANNGLGTATVQVAANGQDSCSL